MTDNIDPDIKDYLFFPKVNVMNEWISQLDWANELTKIMVGEGWESEAS